jgi:hypothetical protein
VSLFGVIFFRRFADTMTAMLPGAHAQVGGSANLDPATIDNLPSVVKNAAFHAISHAIVGDFWWAVPVTAGVFFLALFVKEIPLRSRIEPAPEQATAAGAAELVH